MKRTPLRKVSVKQSRKNRTWSELKLARIKEKIAVQGFVRCEGEFRHEDGVGRCLMMFWNVEDAQRGLQAHHKEQRSLCGAYTDENMSLFCSSCHDYAHSAEGLKSERFNPD